MNSKNGLLVLLCLSILAVSNTSLAAISKELSFNAKIKNIESSNIEVLQNGRVFRVPKSLVKQTNLKTGQNISLKLNSTEFRKIKEVALKTKVARIPKAARSL